MRSLSPLKFSRIQANHLRVGQTTYILHHFGREISPLVRPPPEDRSSEGVFDAVVKALISIQINLIPLRSAASRRRFVSYINTEPIILGKKRQQ